MYLCPSTVGLALEQIRPCWYKENEGTIHGTWQSNMPIGKRIWCENNLQRGELSIAMFDYLRVFPAFQTKPNLPTMHEGTNQKLWGYIYIYGTISTINNCEWFGWNCRETWLDHGSTQPCGFRRSNVCFQGTWVRKPLQAIASLANIVV